MHIYSCCVGGYNEEVGYSVNLVNKSDEVSKYHAPIYIVHKTSEEIIIHIPICQMIKRKNPDVFEIMTQKCVDFNFIALCKTTIRAEDHGLDRSISPTHI